MKYYIQNKKAGYLGNAILFWAKGRNGYTANLDNSEIFEEEEAREICLGNPVKNVAWSVDYIDNNRGIQRIIDSQYITAMGTKDFEKETLLKSDS